MMKRKNYVINDYFQLSLPDDWTVNIPIRFKARLDDKAISIEAAPYPKNNSTEEYFNKNIENILDNGNGEEKARGKIFINGKEAFWVLISSNAPSPLYGQYYFVCGTQYLYHIIFHGLWDKLDDDRESINAILSNFKILE